MFTYPKIYPVKIKIVGLLTSPSFQRLKHCVKVINLFYNRILILIVYNEETSSH